MGWMSVATSWLEGAPPVPSSPTAGIPIDAGSVVAEENKHPVEIVRATQLEAAGDLDGAMEALLILHRKAKAHENYKYNPARAAEAVRLAHELSQRHPRTFESKGCPVHGGKKSSSSSRKIFEKIPLIGSGSRAQEKEKPAGTEIKPIGVDENKEAEELSTPRNDVDRGSRSVEEISDDASSTSLSLSGSPSFSSPVLEATTGLPAATAADVVGVDISTKEQGGEETTPWERGWNGPASFKPPPSATDTLALTTRSKEEKDGEEAGVLSTESETRSRNFTIAQLNAFDGGQPTTPSSALSSKGRAASVPVARRRPRPIYIAIRGKVYDASAGRDLYGPGGKYCEFAGHDISQRVARGYGASTNSSGSPGSNSGELDDLSLDSLERFEMMTLDGWENTFAARGYPVLGPVVVPPPPRRMSREELRAYDGRGATAGGTEEALGSAAASIYLGVKDRVFDVSFGGSEFYTEGGAYECLAGRDASRVLAKMSMTPDDIEGVLDYASLTERESKNLDDWVEKLGTGKGYPVVGWIDL